MPRHTPGRLPEFMPDSKKKRKIIERTFLMMKQNMTYQSGGYSQEAYPYPPDIDKYIADYDNADRRVDEVQAGTPGECPGIHQIFPKWWIRPDAIRTCSILQNFNGTKATYDYDNANRLTSINNQAGANVISNYIFTLDGNGNRTNVAQT